MGFGNLRTLLWLSVASLPLLGSTWTLAVLNASENSSTLSYLLSVAIVVHAAFSLIGYCFINGRVRRNLYQSLLRCIGKKTPLLEGSMGNGSSSQNVNGHSVHNLISCYKYLKYECINIDDYISALGVSLFFDL